MCLNGSFVRCFFRFFQAGAPNDSSTGGTEARPISFCHSEQTGCFMPCRWRCVVNVSHSFTLFLHEQFICSLRSSALHLLPVSQFKCWLGSALGQIWWCSVNSRGQTSDRDTVVLPKPEWQISHSSQVHKSTYLLPQGLLHAANIPNRSRTDSSIRQTQLQCL